MEVKILAWTHSPADLIATAAGTCYGKDDPSVKRVERCYKARHMGVFEHASVTFRIEGISRACSHQLVRHRMASYNQRSQRYCKEGNDYGQVVPASVKDMGFEAEFGLHSAACLELYRKMVTAGVPAEDARYILPQAGVTDIVVTMNVREFYHFLGLRADKHAQWEIRDLAFEMAKRVKEIDDQWAQLVDLWEN